MNKDAIMNVLHKGAEVEGNIKISGSIRIDGKIKGNIEASEKIVIGETGNIDGEIHGKEIKVSGKCSGSVIATNLVSFQTTAEFDGDIKCKKLIVEEGVLLDGNVNMKEEKIRDVKKESKEE